MLTFKMTTMFYFGNISVKISPNNNKMDIFRIYTERAVEKCPRWNFQTLFFIPSKSDLKWLIFGLKYYS